MHRRRRHGSAAFCFPICYNALTDSSSLIPVHIGIDASRANRFDKTGVEWYAWNLIHALKQCASGSEDSFSLYTNVPLIGDLAICPPHWREQVLAWFPRRVWTQGRLSLEMLAHAPDVLFIPSHVIPVITAKRTVWTCHDIGFERRPELYARWERTYHKIMMRYGIARATHIIAVSEFTKQDMIEVYGIPEDRITVVHHGFYGGSAARERKGGATMLPAFLRGKSYILFVGRIEAKKNIPTLIRAFEIAKQEGSIPKQTQLVLAGKRGYRHEDALRALRASTERESMHYLDWVPSETLHALYANAALYVFPTLYEGFGFPILEAMAWGVPVVASNIPAHREIAAEAAYLTEPSADAFAVAIGILLSDSDLSNKLVQRGYERITQFSWKSAAEKTLTILQNTVQ